jgi:hypothetical protein
MRIDMSVGSVERIRTADGPEERAKAVGLIKRWIDHAVFNEHTITGSDGETVDIKPARKLVVGWVDADGHGAAMTQSFGPWSDLLDEESSRDNWRALSRLLDQAVNPFSSKSQTDRIVSENRTHDRMVQKKAVDKAATVRETPWSCDFCKARYKTKAGVDRHERICTAPRFGHRWTGGHRTNRNTWVDSCSCGQQIEAPTDERGRSDKRAWVAHAEKDRPAELLEPGLFTVGEVVAMPTPRIGVVR